jgi:hypothetical protein
MSIACIDLRTDPDVQGFVFWDTVIDKFVEFDGYHSWETMGKFTASFVSDLRTRSISEVEIQVMIARYIRLIPDDPTPQLRTFEQLPDGPLTELIAIYRGNGIEIVKEPDVVNRNDDGTTNSIIKGVARLEVVGDREKITVRVGGKTIVIDPNFVSFVSDLAGIEESDFDALPWTP